MPEALHALDLILRKRSGGQLTDPEIHFFIQAVLANGSIRNPDVSHPATSTPQITDAQLGALLMAIYQHGLSPRELATLTSAMRLSGETFDARTLDPATPVFCVDKHSTGGVGDKTSLLIAPILAAAGLTSLTPAGIPSLCVPMISGRSLGHTGGTLDKLETIPGFDTQLSMVRFAEVLRHCGAALIGQTTTLVPADRLLYAMRDHTGTVESPYLIAASIMSKKLAESLDALVLDVKVGSGAFLPTLADAELLASLMVEAGTRAGTETVALLTRMDEPIGRFAGNWIEVAECIEILQNRVHSLSRDLVTLSLTLAGHMLHLARRAPTPEAGAALASDLLQSGAAYTAWLRLVRAQGGDITVFDHPFHHHKPAAQRTLHASHAGYLASMDCKQVGWAVQRLGAGRTRPGDPVSAHAGIEMHAKLGDQLEPQQPIITLFAEDPELLNEPEHMIRQSLLFSADPPSPTARIQSIVTRGTLELARQRVSKTARQQGNELGNL